MRCGVALMLLSALLLGGCSAPDGAERLERFVAEAVSAVENRRTGYFRQVLSSEFRDDRGNDYERLIATIRAFFLLNNPVTAHADIVAIEWDGTVAAEVTLAVTLDAPKTDFAGELHLRLLERDGQWQVLGAEWQRSRDNLLPGF